MKLCWRETSQVGESGGRRVTHMPSRATHASAREGQLSEKDMRVTAHGSLVIRVLASSG